MIVIGGGLAGMVTAVGVAQAGLRAKVFEQSAEERYLCNSRLTGGVFHCALRPADTPPRELAEIIGANRGDFVNRELGDAIAHDVLPAIRWLQTLGVRFIRGSADPWHKFVLAPPSLGRGGEGWRGRGGDVLLRLLEAELLRCGGEVWRGQRVTGLAAADCVVHGVRLDHGVVEADHVVIADGGFQQDAALLRDAISPRPDQLVRRNAGTGQGDGLRMAKEAGAAITGLGGFYGHVQSRDALIRDDLRFYPWLDPMASAGLVVTPDGRRLGSAGASGIEFANRIAALSAPASATVIWDEEIWRGPARARFTAPNPFLDRLNVTVHRATSIERLAELAGLEPCRLHATVAEHNADVAAGTLAGSVRPIRTPPFAAAPAAAGLTYTMGGIAVDACSQAQSTSGEPIRSLFAVGGASGGVEGGSPVAYVGGLSKAAATGWRAARTIVSAHGMADGQ